MNNPWKSCHPFCWVHRVYGMQNDRLDLAVILAENNCKIMLCRKRSLQNRLRKMVKEVQISPAVVHYFAIFFSKNDRKMPLGYKEIWNQEKINLEKRDNQKPQTAFTMERITLLSVTNFKRELLLKCWWSNGLKLADRWWLDHSPYFGLEQQKGLACIHWGHWTLICSFIIIKILYAN